MTTIEHPEHGTLTIGSRVGRSRVCTKQDGSTVTLSSKLINKLTAPGPTPAAPEEFVASCVAYLESMADGPERLNTAKSLWEYCDRVLGPQ